MPFFRSKKASPSRRDGVTIIRAVNGGSRGHHLRRRQKELHSQGMATTHSNTSTRSHKKSHSNHKTSKRKTIPNSQNWPQKERGDMLLSDSSHQGHQHLDSSETSQTSATNDISAAPVITVLSARAPSPNRLTWEGIPECLPRGRTRGRHRKNKENRTAQKPAIANAL